MCGTDSRPPGGQCGVVGIGLRGGLEAGRGIDLDPLDRCGLARAGAALVPTAEKEPVVWCYTTDRPCGDWPKPAFDAPSWKEGPAGFGSKGTPNVNPRTVWKTSDIWIRREVTLPDVQGRELQLRLYHDDDAEVYLNGVLAGKFAGYSTKYEVAEIPAPAVAALRAGKNVIAIHCHQVRGGQFVDAGLDVLVQPPAGK